MLQGLYQVRPWPQLLADLPRQQQVCAAILAELWDLPLAFNEAVRLLTAATYSADVSAVLARLLTVHVPASLEHVLERSCQAMLNRYDYLPEVPDSLLPVFKTALLSKYGDLEAVWAPGGAPLRKSLLALPLPAMELLLGSDELKVRHNADQVDTYAHPLLTHHPARFVHYRHKHREQ